MNTFTSFYFEEILMKRGIRKKHRIDEKEHEFVCLDMHLKRKNKNKRAM